MGKLRPEAVSTALGPALQLTPEAAILARGLSPTSLRLAVTQIRERAFTADRHEGAAEPPEALRALTQSDLTTRRVRLPRAWIRSALIALCVGGGLAAIASPLGGWVGASLHSIWAVAIAGGGMGLGAALRQAWFSRADPT